MATNPAKFTWDEGERRFRDRFGRFVKRTDVRASLDTYLDNVVLEIRSHTEALQDGRIEISEWQTRMEGSIKRGHTAATAIAKGGWKQVGPADWGTTGQRIQFHYSKLRRFAMELEAGAYPMDGRLLARAEMYGLGPTSTYERILRADDQLAGFRWERRILHSQSPCVQCTRYYDQDWQPIGTLPNIGEQCACLTRCRCTFERSRAETMPKRRGEKMSTAESNLDSCDQRRRQAAFNEEKCDQRRRQAALRDHVEASPVIIHSAVTAVSGAKLTRSMGKLPIRQNVMLSINALHPGGKTLSSDDVYIHYIEAANSNFIGDRFMHLDGSTLRNIASQGASGVAFMNSHRTGGLSSPAELPYGRSFAGRYEEYSDGEGSFSRALLGVYMLKGQYPNGPLGMSTDALHAGIESGTITDVSVGLNQGTPICDVCGADLEESECKHIPGSTYGLTDEEREGQAERGVRDGKASYSLFNGQLSEVSAVYKGAVPGAGFRKSLQFMNSPQFADSFGSELLAAYGPMFKRRQKSKLQGKRTMDFASFLKMFRAADESGVLDDIDLSGTAVPRKPVPIAEVSFSTEKTAADFAAMKAEVDARSAELATRERALDVAAFTVEADRFVAELKASHKATPFELDAIKAGYVLAAFDDKYHPLDGIGNVQAGSTRLQVFKDSHSQRTASDLTKEKVGDATMPLVKPGETVLAGEADPNPNPEKPTPERLLGLLQTSEEGRTALAALAALAESKQTK